MVVGQYELTNFRFEGMKAYRQEDGTVRLFRPDKNMARMNRVSPHPMLERFLNASLGVELAMERRLIDNRALPGLLYRLLVGMMSQN